MFQAFAQRQFLQLKSRRFGAQQGTGTNILLDGVLAQVGTQHRRAQLRHLLLDLDGAGIDVKAAAAEKDGQFVRMSSSATVISKRSNSLFSAAFL